MTQSGFSYQDAGVNIDAGNALVDRIKAFAQATHIPGVLAGIGGFGALFELPLHRYRQPLLVSGTDGVGTKLKLALELQRYDTIGIDLVAMCVNDILVYGAEPLFFLDYFATGKLDVDIGESIIAGIAHGCQIAGAALIGGETAEMPGFYQGADFDLAGFCVGIVEKEKCLNGKATIKAGDVLIGLASSGPHSNGYSLIRKILAERRIPLSQAFATQTLGEVLLTPTRIYVKPILHLLNEVKVKALAHITGGGIPENLPRVLPDGLVPELVDRPLPSIFQWLQEQGAIADQELQRTFNCGVGMVVCVAKEDEQRALDILSEQGEQAFILGSLIKR